MSLSQGESRERRRSKRPRVSRLPSGARRWLRSPRPRPRRSPRCCNLPPSPRGTASLVVWCLVFGGSQELVVHQTTSNQKVLLKPPKIPKAPIHTVRATCLVFGGGQKRVLPHLPGTRIWWRLEAAFFPVYPEAQSAIRNPPQKQVINECSNQPIHTKSSPENKSIRDKQKQQEVSQSSVHGVKLISHQLVCGVFQYSQGFLHPN